MGLKEIQELKANAGKPKPKKIYQIPKKSAKKIAMEKMEQTVVYAKPAIKGTSELNRWFEQRHKELTGTCKHCGGSTQKGKDNFKNSIAHILPKAYFKSVATHPLNFIELCFYGKSCHTNFDTSMLDITELNCFDEVIEKFIAMYPSIAQEEKRRIPAILLQYVKDNT